MKVQVNSHAEKRAAEYPSVEEQLDALWHAMDSGEVPKAQGWYDTIAQVKSRHPKGAHDGEG